MWLESLTVRILNALVRRPNRSVARGVLLGSRIGPFEEAGVAVWPEARLCEHAVVVGKTGVGKTNLLLNVACQHMRQGRGFLFVDFHGDATEQLLLLAAAFPEARERLVLVDPADPTRSPGLNPMEVTGQSERDIFARSSEVASILRQRWGSDWPGPRSEELLRNVLYTLAANRLTLAEAPMLLTRAEVRQGLAARVHSHEVRDYWSHRFEPLSDAMKRQFSEPLLNRITAFLTDPLVRHFVGQQTSTIDFTEAMAQGRWVIVSLPKSILAEHAHTLANLAVAKLQGDVFARGKLRPDARRIFAILCDEVQNLKENDLNTLLTEGRKFGVSIIAACQFWDQLPPSLRGALLAAGTQMFFRVSSADAVTLSAELSIDSRRRYATELGSLSRGEAIVRVGAEPPQRIRVPRLPSITAARRAEAAVLASLSRRLYSRDRGEIERGIEQRQNRTTEPNPHPDEPHPDEGQRDW